MNFQEIIMRLENFWASQGCVIQQPYDIEVGAGTMNPATTLRVLGPEPWRVAYVEPSRSRDSKKEQNDQEHSECRESLWPSSPNRALYTRVLLVV